ncbi:MAG TPA: peptide deformylase [Gemmatimonadaceae bacterium]|nr:peptide deformylase [Gemmatimonadaceae bacterium]
MSLLDIYLLDAPILREVTEPVGTVTDELRRLADDMFETMAAAKGIGLAAPQVGRRERLCVVDVDGARFVLFDPEITRTEGADTAEEGCLSIPDVYGDVTRPASVTVRALDRDGKPFELEATGLLARCIQHEVDHLHGKLFIDYLSLLKRRAAIAKYRKLHGPDRVLTRKVVPAEAAEHHHRAEEL